MIEESFMNLSTIFLQF